MASFNLRKMFSLDIFLTNQLDFTKTIIPLALIAYESMDHLAFGLMGYWLVAHSDSRNIIVKCIFQMMTLLICTGIIISVANISRKLTIIVRYNCVDCIVKKQM